MRFCDKKRSEMRAKEREAIAELAMGVLDREWVLAKDLAELIGCSAPALHAAMSAGVSAGQFDRRIEPVKVSAKSGFLDRVFFRRAEHQPVPLPDWLSPALVYQGAGRVVKKMGDESWDMNL